MTDHHVINLKSASRGKWLAECIKGTSGSPLPIIANVLLALRHDHGLRDAFAYDEMQRQAMLLHLIGSPLAPFELRAVCDEDVAYVSEYLQLAGLKHVGSGVVRDAIRARALENSYHPVRDYLANLQWDGLKRVLVGYQPARSRVERLHVGSRKNVLGVDRARDDRDRLDRDRVLNDDQRARDDRDRLDRDRVLNDDQRARDDRDRLDRDRVLNDDQRARDDRDRLDRDRVLNDDQRARDDRDRLDRDSVLNDDQRARDDRDRLDRDSVLNDDQRARDDRDRDQEKRAAVDPQRPQGELDEQKLFGGLDLPPDPPPTPLRPEDFARTTPAAPTAPPVTETGPQEDPIALP